MTFLTQEQLSTLPQIFQSVYHDDLDAVNDYIAQGGDLNIEHDVMTLLEFAAAYDKLEILNRLIDAGCDPKGDDESAILSAMDNGRLDIVKRLVEVGYDPKVENNNAFIRAAANGHLDVMNLLLSCGCEPQAQNDKAIYLAAENGHLDVFNALLEIGCDPKIGEKQAIQSAAENGHLDFVKRLVELGCTPEGCNNYPLFKAAENGHLDVVKFLIDAGSDPQSNNYLAIRAAAKNGHAQVVFALYDAVLVKGECIDRNLTEFTRAVFDRRAIMMNNLPMIFSAIAKDYGEGLVNAFANIVKHEGGLFDKDMDILTQRTTAAFNVLTSKSQNAPGTDAKATITTNK